jgi:lipoate-protein ligase A
MYSYNLPHYSGEDSFKTQYNYLLNKHSVPIAIHIKLDDTWTAEDKQLLSRMCQTCVYETLLELGVSKDDLATPKNDLMFQGRKFAGVEHAGSGDVYSENMAITLQVLPEQEIFQRLKGKYALRRPITGISEEVPSVTKEAFIEELIKKINMYINKHFC